jgi:hypothetical protein
MFPLEAFTILIVAFPLSMAAAFLIAKNDDRAFLLGTVLVAWLVLVPLTAYVNEWMPFAGGGDDETYYRLAETDVGGLDGAFDFSKFRMKMEQPGYPWVLHIVSAVTGHELLVYKFVNLFLFIVLSLIWYRIGCLLEPQDSRFGKGMMVICLLLTPLWIYFFFLRKDLLITVVQSWGVLVTIEMWLNFKLRHIVYFGIIAFLLILFRTTLLVQSALVLACSLGSLYMFRGGGSRLNTTIALTAGLGMVAAAIWLSMNPAYMAMFGIHTETRVVSTDSIVETGRAAADRSAMNRMYFPVLYLFTETAGFSPGQWQERDFQWLRGLLSIPWILLIVPFVILGTFYLLQRRERSLLNLGAGSESIRFLSTPWNTILVFVASSVMISWIVGDTTRWRIPDMPMLAAIAYLGWLRQSKHRIMILVAWLIFVFLSATMFHLMRGTPA